MDFEISIDASDKCVLICFSFNIFFIDLIEYNFVERFKVYLYKFIDQNKH